MGEKVHVKAHIRHDRFGPIRVRSYTRMKPHSRDVDPRGPMHEAAPDWRLERTGHWITPTLDVQGIYVNASISKHRGQRLYFWAVNEYPSLEALPHFVDGWVERSLAKAKRKAEEAIVDTYGPAILKAKVVDAA